MRSNSNSPISGQRILGISAYYHDSAAALIDSGSIIAAAQEERFTRKKHDARFPAHAIQYCLRESPGKVDAIVFYEKPFLKFERLLETYAATAPWGFPSFVRAMPLWLRDKLYLKTILQKEWKKLTGESTSPPILFSEHHESHAASAFFPSPFETAAVLCLDGVGEWATSSAWMGNGAELKPLWEERFPHSLGLLYSAFTYYTGFKVNSGEYKVMGLAPYGEPKYVQTILDHLIDLKDDGSFRINMEYMGFATGLRMTNRKFDRLMGGPPRKAESTLTQREMDLARSIQDVTELVVTRLARSVQKQTGARALCLAGGVALNCVANGKILREGIFPDGLWIQPAAGDAGGALGAAFAVWHGYFGQPRSKRVAAASGSVSDAMQGGFLGPRYSQSEISQILQAEGVSFTEHTDAELAELIARELASERVIGWFQGRMEFGPRALGGRSILGDPRSARMQSVMNLKIKFRESFRPFAPSVLAHRAQEYFDLPESQSSPYMLLVADVQDSKRKPTASSAEGSAWGIERLNQVRSEIPAVTHVDYSARIQTVTAESNPKYFALLTEFDRQTGCPVLVNTSFNVRGEPIVGSPRDALRCFARTEMDVLVLENAVIRRTDLPESWKSEHSSQGWKEEFELD